MEDDSRSGEGTRFSTARMTPSEVVMPTVVDPSCGCERALVKESVSRAVQRTERAECSSEADSSYGEWRRMHEQERGGEGGKVGWQASVIVRDAERTTHLDSFHSILNCIEDIVSDPFPSTGI